MERKVSDPNLEDVKEFLLQVVIDDQETIFSKYEAERISMAIRRLEESLEAAIELKNKYYSDNQGMAQELQSLRVQMARR